MKLLKDKEKWQIIIQVMDEHMPEINLVKDMLKNMQLGFSKPTISQREALYNLIERDYQKGEIWEEIERRIQQVEVKRYTLIRNKQYNSGQLV